MTLAERVLALKDNKQAYLDLGEDEPDEQILATAAEIDANMTYLGLDDAIIQLAYEVRMLEEKALVVHAESLSPQPGDAIVVKLPKETHPDVFDNVQEFLARKFPKNTCFVAHENAELSIIPRREFEEQEESGG